MKTDIKLVEFKWVHLAGFEYLDVESIVLGDPSYRMEMMEVIAQSDKVYSLFDGEECLAFGGQVDGDRMWCILSKRGTKGAKHIIRAIREELARGIIGTGTYVPEIEKYERFAKLFGLKKTSKSKIVAHGQNLTWWELA